MEKNYQTIELKFSYSEGRIIANAQKGVEVLERKYGDEKVKLKIRKANINFMIKTIIYFFKS